jgi:hypothetical protein
VLEDGHDLLLIERQAVGLCERRLDRGIPVLELGAVAAAHVLVDLLGHAGSHAGVGGREVVDALRLDLLGDRGHVGEAVPLEDAADAALGEDVHRLGVDGAGPRARAACRGRRRRRALADQALGVGLARERDHDEQVDLEEAEVGDDRLLGRLAERGDEVVVLGRLLHDRHQLVQRLAGEHDAGRVL